MATLRTRRVLIGVSCAALTAAAVGVHYGWGPLLAQTSPRAHWEPYKTRSAKPSVDQKLTDPALTGAIDLHAHFGPDAYARQWDAFEIAADDLVHGLHLCGLRSAEHGAPSLIAGPSLRRSGETIAQGLGQQLLERAALSRRSRLRVAQQLVRQVDRGLHGREGTIFTGELTGEPSGLGEVAPLCDSRRPVRTPRAEHPGRIACWSEVARS